MEASAERREAAVSGAMRRDAGLIAQSLGVTAPEISAVVIAAVVADEGRRVHAARPSWSPE